MVGYKNNLNPHMDDRDCDAKETSKIVVEDMAGGGGGSTNDDNAVKATVTDQEISPEDSSTDDSRKEEVIVDDMKYLPSSLPDSGNRREFMTGSVRDMRIGKGRFDLMSPIALLRYAKHMEAGMEKYGERNWEKGQPLMSYIDSAMRHMNKWILNRLTGMKDEEDHMAAAMWNIASFMHTQETIKLGYLPPELDDIPSTKIVCDS